MFSGESESRTQETLTEMKTKSLFNRKVQLAFGSAILALFVVGAMSFRGIAVSTESDRWVRHTHEVLEGLQSSLSTMQDVESSYRGFVITGNEQSLKSYRASIMRSQQEETIIRNLTEDNPEQQQRISNLHRLADQKIQFAETIIGLRRTKGLEAASYSVRTGEGQQTMDEYQDVIRKMQDEELRLLVLREAALKPDQSCSDFRKRPRPIDRHCRRMERSARQFRTQACGRIPAPKRSQVPRNS
jgi:CHASE3 domain sensor protein